jgi:eukaryotic-like serine/threonine-protein kinase
MLDQLSQLGPYEILGPLGAGGMGQVYRARDTRLQRNVALKILHESSALDADRRRRFAQEAIAASALNHPNILTVYDVGVEGDVPYLVAELIDGVSLRTEMHSGRVPLKRMIDVTHQIAEGLAAAHEAGIVHRDLKPENVMVTADGRVKIVDFGLAQIEEAAGTGTLATRTAEGLLFGTVPYMSPEQARGERADFRSDQFALGVMLYEMAAGTHPFWRDTAVQTLSAIITDDPPDPVPAAGVLPMPLLWLVRRLLAKRPRERYAHTADLAADLRNVRDHLSEATSVITAGLPVPPRGRRGWLVPLAAVALAAGAGVAGLALGPRDAGVRFDRYTPLATDAGYQKSVAWSPDGKQVAYEAEVNGVVQIFTRSLDSAMRTKVTASTFGCFEPAWSSDGYIYYHSQSRNQDGLWRVSPVGGEPQLMIEGASHSAISPDGKTIAFLRTESAGWYSMTLWMASPVDAPPRRFDRGTFKEKAGSSGFLRFSADGTRLLVWFGANERGKAGFWQIEMPDGEPREVLPTLSSRGQSLPSFSWLHDGRHIVVTRSDGPTPGSHLWVADTASGEVAPITSTLGNESAPSVAPDGRTIAFTSETTDFDLVEAPIDGSPLMPFLSSTRNEYDPAASPASTQYAFVTDRTGQQQIWLQNEEGYLQQALVTEGDFGGVASVTFGSLAFSPDGRRLAFQRAARLWITSLSGGSPVPIGSDEEPYQDAPSWSPDGEWLAYLTGNMDDLSLVKVRVGARTAPTVVMQGGIPPFLVRPQWSPNGTSILCETKDGLKIVAADGSGAHAVGTTGWLAYAWGDDERTIYGLHATDDANHFMLVSVDTRSGAERVINANLGPIPQALQPIRGFSRLRGRGFLTSIARVRSDIYLIEGFELPLTWWQRLWRWNNTTRP